MRGRSSGKTGPPVPGLTRVGGGAIKGARSTSTYWQLGRWVERRFSKTMDRIRFQAGLHRKHDRKRRDEKENILFRFLVKKGGRGVLLGGGGGAYALTVVITALVILKFGRTLYHIGGRSTDKSVREFGEAWSRTMPRRSSLR